MEPFRHFGHNPKRPVRVVWFDLPFENGLPIAVFLIGCFLRGVGIGGTATFPRFGTDTGAADHSHGRGVLFPVTASDANVAVWVVTSAEMATREDGDQRGRGQNGGCEMKFHWLAESSPR